MKNQRTQHTAVRRGKGVIIHILSCALLLSLFTATAAAAYVPDNDISENRDGRQLIIRTYTLSPDDDPDALIGQPFEREGFRYTFSSISKQEQPFTDRKSHSETVTVQTDSDDLAAILSLLPSTLDYELDGYAGTLSLDHNSMKTEATGYTTKSYTVTDTKTHSGLDRNDPSYIPKSTTKNGVTLKLTDIEWSEQYEVLDDGAVVTSSYTAVAKYAGSYSKKVADGYLSTAIYSGEVSAAGIASVVYTVTYLGELIPILAMEPVQEPASEPATDLPGETRGFPYVETFVSALVVLLVLGALSYYTKRRRTK